MMAIDVINSVNIIHPVGDMNERVCTRFHGNPCSGCRDTSVRPTNINLVGALEETYNMYKRSYVRTFFLQYGRGLCRTNIKTLS